MVMADILAHIDVYLACLHLACLFVPEVAPKSDFLIMCNHDKETSNHYCSIINHM